MMFPASEFYSLANFFDFKNTTIMKIVKISLLALSMALTFGATSSLAYAEAASSADANVAATISHLESALAEVTKSDFSTARGHFKSARAAAENISGHEDIVSKANAFVIQGQIKSQKGDVAGATEQLNQALKLYKSI
jgi:hypothetical protein